MGGTKPAALDMCSSSLLVLGGGYRRVSADEYYFVGERPGAEWVAHGSFPRRLWVLVSGRRRRIVVHKQRWRRREPLPGEPLTCHSRPPDDLASVWSCSLVVVLSLWSWMRSGLGVHRFEPEASALREHPSRRTLQRWLRRARPHALATQHALRAAVIDRCEPRPVEQLFEAGLSPPDSDSQRDPPPVWQLKTGLAFVLRGAKSLRVATPRLLAEARRRWHPTKTPFLI